MSKLPELPVLSDDHLAALTGVTSPINFLGAQGILSFAPIKDGGMRFSFIFQLPGGALVSGHDDDPAQAYLQARVKYDEYRAKPRPITSAVEAVNLIRERLASGEAPADVLDSINVA
ncbi:MAG: hypothetical protein E6R03_12375 [Hyphomicrobiaceae bacterium]|nr:MAG: hypothetical protein E6R03_12375 [Hyphomicrobiaceae bacterium]